MSDSPSDHVPFHHKLAYGVGAFVNNTLGAAIGELMKVLNLAMHIDPATVGWIGAIPRLVDAITDPLVGYLSDKTSSQWGRRRPWIFSGAILVGLVFIALWMFPLIVRWIFPYLESEAIDLFLSYVKSEWFVFVWFVIGSVLFYIAYTVFATPWVALGYELTPDPKERTALMGVQNWIGQFAFLLSPWFMWVTTLEWFRDQVEGAAALALVIGVGVMFLGVIPALVLRERPLPPRQENTKASGPNPEDFFDGGIKSLTNVPFLLLCVATFLVFNGFVLIAAFQYYVITYYIFAGDQALAAEYSGYAGTVGTIATFMIIPLVSVVANQIGKRTTLIIAIALSVVGYASKWFLYDPANPWLILLPAPLMAFGLGSLFTLIPAMMADVVDLDELKTDERREGMFGSMYWFAVKIGMFAAIAMGGYLLNFTGFDVELGGDQSASTLLWMRAFDAIVPAVASVIAIIALILFPVNEARAKEIREALAAKRA